jgi:pimeloyl-ACP methyl ester carboxylesterase
MMKLFPTLISLLTLCSAPRLAAEPRAAVPAVPDVVTPERLSEWHGGERHDFTVGGRAALLVYPRTPAPGRPWIWRTEFFGHEPQADAALLAKGWHVAYLDVQNLYGAPVALDAMDDFYDHMVKGRGLAAKVVLEGFSRGGLFSLNWAIRHPNWVSSLYNDAPVCDFTTWPKSHPYAKPDWERLLKAWGLTEAEALAGHHSPVHHLEGLAKAKVPLLHVCGAADEAVPFAENTGLVESRYKALGGEIQVISKPGGKHHPHSLVDPTPIVDFVTAHFTAKESEVGSALAQPATIDPALPNVLLLGDSISIGYTPETRRLLAGRANVWRLPVNGGPTTKGLKYLPDWLHGRKWSVIHFNWGLHDLKHVGANPDTLVALDSPGAHYQVPLADYEKHLTTLTAQLQQTGAKLIWAETTPVPPGAQGRRPGDETAWNTAAARIMTAAGVPTDALWAHASAKPTLQRPKDVHFTPEGSAWLAEAVTKSIQTALNQP